MLTRRVLRIPLAGILAGAVGACVLSEEFFSFDNDPVPVDAGGGGGGIGGGGGSAGAPSSSGTAPTFPVAACEDDTDCTAPTDCEEAVGAKCENKKCVYPPKPDGTLLKTLECSQAVCYGGTEVTLNTPRYRQPETCKDKLECDGYGHCLLGLHQVCSTGGQDGTPCASGICEGDKCRRGLFGPCLDSTECGQRFSCALNNQYAPALGVCKLTESIDIESEKCAESADCYSNLCKEGLCLKECSDDVNASNHCDEPHTCNVNKCRKECPNGPSDCGTGQVYSCINDICSDNCAVDDQCAPEHLCVNTYCVRQDALGSNLALQ